MAQLPPTSTSVVSGGCPAFCAQEMTDEVCASPAFSTTALVGVDSTPFFGNGDNLGG